uniref:NADH-ubiquinone oxidoreductase chain 6 n=1 Tax=Byturus ochraceus TaxID=153018 RepID=A0A343A3Q7_9CUCU|nr:NADH dehydrogenase subunit 6 [Byturus ochraceus]AOY39185.1 NADH dehydrogenase subunit 6 [Byturus ochraceus]
MLSMIIINMSFTLLFLFLKHPLSMGCNLLIQTMIVSLIIGLININFWYSYILFLVFIGGMLVLFIYMTSIASNEKFHLNMKLMMMLLLMMSCMIIMMLIDNFYLSQFMLNHEMNMLNSISIENLSMNKYLNMPNSFIYILIIFYLLITMIAVVKITGTKSGPLRQMY